MLLFTLICSTDSCLLGLKMACCLEKKTPTQYKAKIIKYGFFSPPLGGCFWAGNQAPDFSFSSIIHNIPIPLNLVEFLGKSHSHDILLRLWLE